METGGGCCETKHHHSSVLPSSHRHPCSQVATNLKLLESANVDTYIVVRSLVPIFTLGMLLWVTGYLPAPGPWLCWFRGCNQEPLSGEGASLS